MRDHDTSAKGHAEEVKPLISRREAIVAAAALLGGVVLGGPSEALATTGVMHYGEGQDAGSDMTVIRSSSPEATFYALADFGGTGPALIATSDNSTGEGLYGRISQANNPAAAVRGRTEGDGFGVLGEATGLHAVAVRANHAYDGGVALLASATGHGTAILASTGDGGVAIDAATPANGVGLYAHGTSGGRALRVEGVASFSRAGKSYVSNGHSTRTVYVASGVSTTSLILVTLQNSPGSVLLRCAKRSDATHFKVYLNHTATATTYFSWFVVG